MNILYKAWCKFLTGLLPAVVLEFTLTPEKAVYIAESFRKIKVGESFTFTDVSGNECKIKIKK